ncbi:MAG: hypothetical protein H7Z39_04295 [Burkholderiaceae bacterium]|nr:hypothetical protein [Burkholderiaceae bacterium]
MEKKDADAIASNLLQHIIASQPALFSAMAAANGLQQSIQIANFCAAFIDGHSEWLVKRSKRD